MKVLKGMRFPGKGMGWKEFLVSLKNEYTKDNVGDVAGNLTFQLMLALFPFLIFLVSLASLFLDPQNIQNVVQSLSKVAPPAVTQIITERLKSLQQSGGVGVLTVSVLAAVWAASGGMVALMRALNTAYDVQEERPFWKVRGIAILATLFAAAMGIVATVAAVATPAVAHFLGEPLGTIVLWLRLPVAGLVMMLVWAVLYWLLPDAEQSFRFITPGSVVGVVVWLLASWGFSIYVNNFSKYDATYGALGGVVVMLLWMWISSQVLLVGAEINAIIEHKSPEGKRAGAKSLADKGVDDSKSEKAEKLVGGHATPAMQRQAREAAGDLPPRSQWGAQGTQPRPATSGFHRLRDRLWAVGAAISFFKSRRRHA